ncbi:Hyptothetical protein [Vibrio vulnificus CMCP6]|uniref:Hyptothetical protein n=1 Tax=Vibrio vulnificus (strain CMCP6) TaxID=216895 RepID=A0A3Q0L5U1_VIBVU|nr:Hyptothetical protein [Vibrio vulnificus CMCP6]
MFDSIEVCSTWQCVNSFSSWFSAIVSPIIAFLSLYISFKAYTYAKEKISLRLM